MYTPPTGNQPPYGNQGSYVPPGAYQQQQQRPSSNGCWLWGGLGCLVVFLLFAGLIGWSAYSFTHGKAGKSFGSVMSSASKMADDMKKSKAVEDALNRYKTDNGHYPASLTDLVPKYLPDRSALHTESDPNTDPTHISFEYKQPALQAPGTTVLLSFHTGMEMNMGVNEKVDEKINLMINGNQTMDTTSTVTTPDGKTVTQTSHTDMSTGKSSPTSSGFPGMPSSGSTPTTPLIRF